MTNDTPLSVSEALSFQNCEQRHSYEYIAKRIPQGQHARALSVGMAAHAAFQEALIAGPVLEGYGPLVGSFGERYRAEEEGGFEAHVSLLVTQSLQARGITPSAEDLDECRAAGRGLRAAYLQVKALGLKIHATEETFRTTIAGRVWRGRWDAIAEDQQGAIWHMQLKTSSRIEQMVSAVRRSFHEALYQRGGRERFGSKYKGTLLLIAVKEAAHFKKKGAPACPCCGKAGLIRRPERAEVRYIRVTDEHEEQRVSDLSRVGNAMRAPQILPPIKSEHACSNTYGRECWFTEACWGGASIHDDLLFEDSDPFSGYLPQAQENA